MFTTEVMEYQESMRYSRRGGPPYAPPYARMEEDSYQLKPHHISPSEQTYLQQDFMSRHPEAHYFDTPREHYYPTRSAPAPHGRYEPDYRSPFPRHTEHFDPRSHRGEHYEGYSPAALTLSPARFKRSDGVLDRDFPPRPRPPFPVRYEQDQHPNHYYREDPAPTPMLNQHIVRPRPKVAHALDQDSKQRDLSIRLSGSHDSGISASASAAAPATAPATATDEKEISKDTSKDQDLNDAMLLATFTSMARSETEKNPNPSATAKVQSNTNHLTASNEADAKLTIKRVKTPSPTNVNIDDYKAVTPSLSSKFVSEMLQKEGVKEVNVSKEIRNQPTQVSFEDTSNAAPNFASPTKKLSPGKKTASFSSPIEKTAPQDQDEGKLRLRHPLSNESGFLFNSPESLKLDRSVHKPRSGSVAERDYPSRRPADRSLYEMGEFERRPRHHDDESLSLRSSAHHPQEPFRPPVRRPPAGSHYDEDYARMARREEYRPPYFEHEERFHRPAGRCMPPYYPPPPSPSRREHDPYYHHMPPPPYSFGGAPPPHYHDRRDVHGDRGDYHPDFKNYWPPGTDKHFRRHATYDERPPERYNANGKVILRRKCAWKNYPELEKFLIANRGEYLRHSAMNYTQEQKQYNNDLTERLLEVANKHNYEFDPNDFNFVSIRDRIRCYYKSYVQNCKKRGITVPCKDTEGKKVKLSNESELHDDDAAGSEPKENDTSESRPIKKEHLQTGSCSSPEEETPFLGNVEEANSLRKDESDEKHSVNVDVKDSPKQDVIV